MKQVRFNGELWDVLSETARNALSTEALASANLIGTILHLKNTVTSEECVTYPWDVWGLEEWENLDGTCDYSKFPGEIGEDLI